MPAEDDRCRRSARWPPTRRAGARVPVQDAAGRWLRRRARTSPRAAAGSSCFDYAATHGRAGRPAVDGLAAHLPRPRPGRPAARPPRPAGHHRARCASTSWPGCARRRATAPRPTGCAAHGIDELVDEGRRAWDERAARRRPRGAAGPQPRAARPRPSSTPPASAASASWSGRPDRPRVAALTGPLAIGSRRALLRLADSAACSSVDRCRRSTSEPDDRGLPVRGPDASRRRDDSRSDALVAGTFLYDEADAGLRGLLGPAGRRPARLGPGLGHDPRVGAALRQVVRRRHAQRHRQLPRPPRRGRPGRQGRLPLGGRAGRHPHDHLRRPARRGAALRQRAEGPRRRAGRPGRHLHADDPRAADGHAGLRPHRRRRTRSCSAASRPTRSPTASTTPRPRCSSPPTAAGGGARPCLLKPNADVALADTPVDHQRGRRAHRRIGRRRPIR